MDESLNRDLYEQIVRGIADGRKKTDADVRRADRRGAVPAGGRAARRPGRRRRVRGSGGRQAARPASARRAHDRRRRLRARQPDVARPEPRAAHRRHLRRRHDHRRQERLRPAQRRGRRLGHARSSTSARRARDSSVRAIVLRDRQPRRIGDGVRRDLARADDRAERTRRSAARRVDVGPGRLGRLLHRDAGAGRSSRSRRR